MLVHDDTRYSYILKRDATRIKSRSFLQLQGLPLTLHYLGAMRAQYQVAINSCCLLISRFCESADDFERGLGFSIGINIISIFMNHREGVEQSATSTRQKRSRAISPCRCGGAQKTRVPPRKTETASDALKIRTRRRYRGGSTA